AQDIFFWGILGALVVWASLREAKRGRVRTAGKKGWDLGLALRTTGTFTAICVLWSLWSADSMYGWLVMWKSAATIRPLDLVALVTLFGLGIAYTGKAWGAPTLGKEAATPWYMRDNVRGIATLLVLMTLTEPAIYGAFGPKGTTLAMSRNKSTRNAHDGATW